ncbi:DNA repair exonuclease [Candidatus Aerophobetes bacterium]|nr:DNA repair exonuclease [Candidatus Aerophobetes bacterium]
MGVKFIHTADVHLKRDDPLRLEILSWIVSQAKQLADGLIIAGDLFESDIEASFLRGRVREIFQKASPLPILIIPGNHDSGSFSCGTEYGDNVLLLSEKPSLKEFRGLKIAAVPFKENAGFSDSLEALTLGVLKSEDVVFDIVITHGTLYDKNFANIYAELEEEAKYMPIYSYEIQDKMRYLALGHYHSRFSEITFEKTKAVYPGSPVVTTARDIGVRYVALVEIDRETIRIERIPVKIAPYWERIEWIVFPGKEEEKLAEIENDIKRKAGEKVMLQGVIKGSIKIAEKKFREKIREIEEKYKSNFKALTLVDTAVKDWTKILEDNPLLALFVKKLGDVSCEELLKEKALELTLSSLERLRE